MTIPYHIACHDASLFWIITFLDHSHLCAIEFTMFPFKTAFSPNYITYCFLSLLLASPQGNYNHIIDPIIYCLHENAKYFYPMATIYSCFNVPQEPQMQHHPIEVITSSQQLVS